MTKEGEIKQHIKKILNDLEVWYCMPTTAGFGRSGVSDFICCVNGRFLAIEAKRGDLQPTALQKRELDRISKSGGGAIVVNGANIDKFEMYMKKIIGLGK